MVLFLALFSLYSATATHDMVNIDASAATVESWRIASTGEPWLEGALPPQLNDNKWVSEADNGHLVGKRMAGPVLAGIPFYLVLSHNADPETFSFVPGAIAASFWTAGSVVLLFLALRRRLQDDHALLAAAIFAVATPTWSVSANMLWTHTVTQFAIAGTAFASSRRNWWLAGLFMSFGMLGRPHLALVAAAVGLVAAAADKSIKPAVGVAVPTLGSLLFLEGWNKWMFGVWSIGGAYAGKADAAVGGFQGSEEWTGSHPQLTNYLGFLFSFDRGFLIWTPIVLLFLPAVVRARREIPAWSWGLAVGGICYTIAQLRINYFAGGEGFYGYRHGLEMLTCLVPILAFASPWLGSCPRMLGADPGPAGRGHQHRCSQRRVLRPAERCLDGQQLLGGTSSPACGRGNVGGLFW